jgi:cell division protein ZapA (FtsZ GTPase activity inhibitor)
MSIVTITLGNREFKLSCPKESHDMLTSLAKKLDIRVENAKANNPSASFELSLVIAALGLVDENQSQRSRTDEDSQDNSSNIELKHTMSDILSELNFVAKKLEKC